MLCGMNTLGGPRNIVLHGVPDPPTDRGGPTFKLWDLPPHISRMAEARDFKFCVHIEGDGPNKNYAKVGHRGLGRGHATPV